MDRVQAILERGRQARAVLDNETVMAAMDHITDQTQKQWRATTAKMTETRESLFHQIAGLDAVRAQLKLWVEQADHEQRQLDKQNARQKLRVVR